MSVISLDFKTVCYNELLNKSVSTYPFYTTANVLYQYVKLTEILWFLSEDVETDEVKEAKRLELEGVKEAEAGNVQKAMELFSKAIAIAPDHSSSYNNRAQALRLQGDVQGRSTF